MQGPPPLSAAAARLLNSNNWSLTFIPTLSRSAYPDDVMRKFYDIELLTIQVMTSNPHLPQRSRHQRLPESQGRHHPCSPRVREEHQPKSACDLPWSLTNCPDSIQNGLFYGKGLVCQSLPSSLLLFLLSSLPLSLQLCLPIVPPYFSSNLSPTILLHCSANIVL